MEVKDGGGTILKCSKRIVLATLCKLLNARKMRHRAKVSDLCEKELKQ